jgi:hypothetical protein
MKSPTIGESLNAFMRRATAEAMARDVTRKKEENQ